MKKGNAFSPFIDNVSVKKLIHIRSKTMDRYGKIAGNKEMLPHSLSLSLFRFVSFSITDVKNELCFLFNMLLV